LTQDQRVIGFASLSEGRFFAKQVKKTLTTGVSMSLAEM
jgi:hypothetical protein